MEQIFISQKQQLAERLKAMKDDITANDRKDAEKALNIDPARISRYLNGRIQNNEIATQLIELFTTKINDRAARAGLIPIPTNGNIGREMGAVA